jgi:signal transduction histidine kinase
LSPKVELNLFRIVQEAINNIEKHAHAKTVKLHIGFQGNSICMKIQVDGRGFNPGRARVNKEKRSGLGLTNMRERAAAIGGTCTVASAPGKGTIITVHAPCKGAP